MQLNNPLQNKKVVLTFIFDDYDALKDPLVVTPGWDYFFLSDRGNVKSEVWKPLNVNQKLIGIESPKRKSSLIKIEHYNYISSNYDICVTLDGSMLLNVNLDRFLEAFWDDKTDFLIARHPHRDCIYDEAAAVLQYKLDSRATVLDQVKRYFSEGFPRHYGLYGTRMMVKNNKSEKLRYVCEIWAKEYRSGSQRDQLSLNYALWKAKNQGVTLNIHTLDFKYLYQTSGMFRICSHRKTRQWQ